MGFFMMFFYKRRMKRKNKYLKREGKLVNDLSFIVTKQQSIDDEDG